MQLELFRISLSPRTQLDFDDLKDENGKFPSREYCIIHIFSQSFVFKVNNTTYHYTPNDSHNDLEGISGRVGRQIDEHENLPPDEGFIEIVRPQWQASHILIDPSHHDDGQQIAIETKLSVGNCNSILKAIADHINKKLHLPYVIEIGPIGDPRTFWDFAKENQGKITRLTIAAPVPNMFEHEENIDRDMKSYRDLEHASTVTQTLSNPDGLNVDTDRVRSGIGYAAKTGGQISARAMNRKSYNSNNKSKKIHTDSDNEVNSIKSLALRALVRILEME